MPTDGLERIRALIESDPQAALKLLEQHEGKVVHAHPAQKKVEDSPARFRVMNAGRRTGKTVIAAKEALKRARRSKKMVWWVAPTYRVVKRGYREVLRQLPKELLTHDPPPDTNFDAGRAVILRFKNGSRMEFYSAERPEGMLGEGVDFAVLDEAAIMPSHIWEQTVYPTLMDRSGGALFISTPRGRNWFYRIWSYGQDPQNTAWDSWTFPTSSNPYIDDDEIEQLRKDLPLLVFQQEVLAEFLAAGSSVFRWEERVVQPAQANRFGVIEGEDFVGHHVVLGVDLAKTTDFTVLYGASARTFRNVYYERMREVSWREQKRRIRRACALLQRLGASGVTLVMDSTGVGDPIVEDIEAYGHDVIPINFTTLKNKMVMLFGKDLEDGRAFILDNAEKKEFENYAMNMTPAGRITYGAPQGEHDDAVSAKILQHWGLVNEGIPDASVITGDIEPDILPSEWDSMPDDARLTEDDFSDLLDPTERGDFEPHREPTAMDLLRPPTVGELLNRDLTWARPHTRLSG